MWEPATSSSSSHTPVLVAPVRRRLSVSLLAIFVLLNLWFYSSQILSPFYGLISSENAISIPLRASEILRECRSLHLKPGVPDEFYKRVFSDRFEPGTKKVLIRNATIWTGRVQGLEIITGDMLLEGGIIKEVGSIEQKELVDKTSAHIIDAQGYVTICFSYWSVHVY
jgi:hypothetical protein